MTAPPRQAPGRPGAIPFQKPSEFPTHYLLGCGGGVTRNEIGILTVHMYKGSTREAQGSGALAIPGNVPTSALPTADEQVNSASSGGQGRGEEAGKLGSSHRCPPFIPEI